MSGTSEISALVSILTAALLLSGAAITLIGSAGLVRLPTFYARTHAPTLGTTLGTTCIAIASVIYFSMLGTRPAMHELLIIVLVVVTTPISLLVLVRAAVFRDQSEAKTTSQPAEKKER